MTELVDKLARYMNPEQIWFVILFTAFWFFGFVLFLMKVVYERGLPKWNGEGFIIPPRDTTEKERSVPKHLRQQIWMSKVIDSNGKKVGSIGFIKNLNVFAFFGDYWNTGYREARDGLEVFEQEWEPPMFIPKEEAKDLECFISVKDIEIQSKFIAVIKKHVHRWKKVYIICSKSQYANGELDSIDPIKNNDLPIVIIPFSTEMKYDESI
jgi:hypothetical protein